MESAGREDWLSLGEACHLLGVNQTTLRQWADDGAVQVFRTPGGHRRFRRSDLESVLRGAGASRQAPGDREAALLRRIRRRLHTTRAAQQPWQAHIDDESRARMRLFGRRLLSLLDASRADRRRRADLRNEAESVGREYGLEMARRGLPLRDTLSAFLFFRNTVPTDDDYEGSDLIEQALDHVLLGIGAGYQAFFTSQTVMAGRDRGTRVS